jgi:GPI mannosyltransferase 3
MNLFAKPVPETAPANTRRALHVFLVLFLIGLGLRGIACAHTTGILHPDEHQQFLEQAYRMVHGYGKTFWEQKRGMRHPLYPALLALPLRILEAVGVRDPLVQAGIIRFLVASFTLWAWGLFAWQFQRRGEPFTALLLMFVFALSPDLIFVQTHLLSETAATVPFLLAVCWLDRRPILAGVMLGVCFGIRFQMGFLIGGLLLLAGLETRFRPRGPFLRLVLSALASLVALGIMDWLVLGYPFQSPVQYFYNNIWLGLSKQWGEHPWYQYFEWLWIGGGPIVAGLTVLLIIGANREWKLAFLTALFSIGHMAVAHKEMRFVLPVVPLVLALIISAVALLINLISARYRTAVVVLVCVICGGFFGWRIREIPWEPHDGYRSASMLLHDAGQRADLTGVGVLGIHLSEYGNYFFLQRDVPLLGVVISEHPYFPDDPQLTDRRINYLIAPPNQIHFYARWQPQPIVSRGRWSLYRLDRSEE